MSRLVILSGPSCVGKSPLQKALAKFHPDLAKQLCAPVLYNCREPRPGEVDGVAYHFRPREYLESLRGKPGYLVMDVRNDIQALAMADVQAVLECGQDAFFEGNAYVATALMDAPELAGVPKLSVFLAPLSGDEIREIDQHAPGQVARIVTDAMRRKLLRRTQKQKGILSLRDLEDIEARCAAAWREMAHAWRFDHVLPNHDGEDSENWDAFYYPLGDARKCLQDFVAALKGEGTAWAERWEEGLAG